MISDVPLELERWVKQEAGRRKQLGLPRSAIYHVICDAIALFRRRTRPGKHVYYVDGHGPFYSTFEALDFLGVPKGDRGKYWRRWDRLPKELANKIEVRNNPAIQEDGLDRKLFRGRNFYYLTDGRGPYSSTHRCLDALGVPEGSRRKYWHRHDRLPARYRKLIIVVKRHRSFVYNGIELPDPDPRLTIDEVRRVYEESFPELGHPTLTVKESHVGGGTVYVFERTHGSKGCDDNEPLKSDSGHRHQWGRSSRALAAV
jgi:PRTRC genetic system protein C